MNDDEFQKGVIVNCETVYPWPLTSGVFSVTRAGCVTRNPRRGFLVRYRVRRLYVGFTGSGGTARACRTAQISAGRQNRQATNAKKHHGNHYLTEHHEHGHHREHQHTEPKNVGDAAGEKRRSQYGPSSGETQASSPSLRIPCALFPNALGNVNCKIKP